MWLAQYRPAEYCSTNQKTKQDAKIKEQQKTSNYCFQSLPALTLVVSVIFPSYHIGKFLKWLILNAGSKY